MLKLLIIINIILLSGQVVLSFGRATQGSELGRLQNQAQTLAAENQHLREAIYSSSSLSHIWTLSSLPVAAARP
ncbi:MAG: hypothetical protein AAB887_00745 [Patescibacteria group bacterium]